MSDGAFDIRLCYTLKKYPCPQLGVCLVGLSIEMMSQQHIYGASVSGVLIIIGEASLYHE